MDIFIFLICCCCCCISLLGGGFYYYTQYKLPSDEKKEMEEYNKKLLIYVKEEKTILEGFSSCRENNNKSCWDEKNKVLNDFYEKFMKDIGEKKGVKKINTAFDKIKTKILNNNLTKKEESELFIIENIRKEVVIKYIEKYALEEEKILIQKYNKSVDLGNSCKEKNNPCWEEMKVDATNFYLNFYDLVFGIKDDKTYGNKSYGDDISKDLKHDKKMDENNTPVLQIKKIISGEQSYGNNN